jgi:hypothetical protein
VQDIEGEASDDYSAWFLAMSADGKRIANGGTYNDSNGDCAGHVRIYKYDGTELEWKQVGQDIVTIRIWLFPCHVGRREMNFHQGPI